MNTDPNAASKKAFETYVNALKKTWNKRKARGAFGGTNRNERHAPYLMPVWERDGYSSAAAHFKDVRYATYCSH